MAKEESAHVCDHCMNAHGHHKAPEGRLCNTCILVPEEKRQMDKKHQARLAKVKQDAEAAAKKAYHEELLAFNKRATAEVLQGDK